MPADLSDIAALSRLEAALPSNAPVISSDLVRASATADSIQKNRTRLQNDSKLREIHFGDWELQTYEDIEAADPERARAYWDNPGDVRPPNGESWNEVCARVNAAIDDLVASHPNRDLIVVAHFGVVLTQVQRALGSTGYDTFGHRIDNLSLTEIRVKPHWETVRINHLP